MWKRLASSPGLRSGPSLVLEIPPVLVLELELLYNSLGPIKDQGELLVFLERGRSSPRDRTSPSSVRVKTAPMALRVARQEVIMPHNERFQQAVLPDPAKILELVSEVCCCSPSEG